MVVLRTEVLKTALTAEDAIARLQQVITPPLGLRAGLSTEYTGSEPVVKLEGAVRGRTFEARSRGVVGSRRLHVRLAGEVTPAEPSCVIVRYGISSFRPVLNVAVVLLVIGVTTKGPWWIGILGVVLFLIGMAFVWAESRDVSSILKEALASPR